MMRFGVPVLLLCAVPVSAAPVPERVPGLVKTLKNGKPGERVIAAEMLGELGPKAEAAVLALAEVIRDTPPPVPIPFSSEAKWSREEAAADFLLRASWDALARIGPRAVPALSDLLAHQDAEIRGHAAAALKVIGSGAADAVPALVGRLSGGENQWVCLNVLEALAVIGTKAETAVPALIETVLDPKATLPKRKPWPPLPMGPYCTDQLPLRKTAAQTLAAIGPKAIPAVKRELFPALIKELDGADEHGRFLSGFGSGDEWPLWAPFGADAAPLVPALVRYLSRHNKSRLMPSLLALGPNGQKALADLLSDKDEPTRKARFFALCEHSREFFRPEEHVAAFRLIVPHLIPFLTGEDYLARFSALALIDRGCTAVPPEVVTAALPLLDDEGFLKYLNKFDANMAAGFVMFCGPAAIPKLLDRLKSNDKERRVFAVRALEGLGGPRTAALLPTLRELAAGKMKHPEITPLDAARSAVRISLAPQDVERLVPFLKSDDPNERFGAIFEFRRLRHLSRPYLKHLFPLLKDREVRWNAALTIDRIDSSDPGACAALADWIADADDRHQLENTGPFAKEIAPAVPAVLKKLERGRGLELVRRIGPPAKDAVPLLVPYLTREPAPNAPNDANQLDHQMVLGAFGAIGPAAKDAVPAIRKLLAKTEGQEKMWCLLCLADIGLGAQAAVPELKELLTDPDPGLRLLAACALSKIEANPGAYRAHFARAIHLRATCAFWDVPFVFDRIAADCPELVPIVVRGITPQSIVKLRLNNDGYEGACEHVMRVLKRNAPAAKATVPELVSYLTKPESGRLVLEFIELLGTIGPDATAALPKLRELRDSENFALAVAAQGAIQQIEAKK